MSLVRTPEGFSLQLRLGQGRRRTFCVIAPDETTAELRAKTVREIARLLVSVGRLLEAFEAISDLCAAGDDFEDVAAGLRELCAEPLPETPEGLGGMTFAQFGLEWTSGRLAETFKHRGKLEDKKTATTDAGHLATLCAIRHPVHGTLGDVPVAAFTLADYNRGLDGLPSRVKSNSTRRHYAQVMGRLMNLAVTPAEIRTSSPIPEGALPDVAQRLEFQCLYPSEDRQLLACSKVDLTERFVFGLAIRTGLRLGNLFDLRRRDVDLDNLQITVPDSKTGIPIGFDIEPDVAAALGWWFERPEWKGKPRSATVLPQWDRTKLAKRLRKALHTAGVDREQLFEKSAHQEPIRFHDLRASFITFALANGKTEAWIRERTGHTTSQMLYLYNRPRLAKLKLRDWVPFDQALGLELGPELAAPAQPVAEADSQKEEHGVDRDVNGVHSLPPAPVVEAGDGAGGLALAGLVAPSQLGGQPLAELPASFGQAELDQLAQIEVGEARDGSVGAHDTLRSGPDSTPETPSFGVASGVASGSDLAVSDMGDSFMVSRSTPGWARTTDRWIRNPHDESTRASELSEPQHESTREHVRALETAHELPVSALDDADRAELMRLCVAAGRWSICEKLSRDLRLGEESRATRSNVTLLVDRRRGSSK